MRSRGWTRRECIKGSIFGLSEISQKGNTARILPGLGRRYIFDHKKCNDVRHPIKPVWGGFMRTTGDESRCWLHFHCRFQVFDFSVEQNIFTAKASERTYYTSLIEGSESHMIGTEPRLWCVLWKKWSWDWSRPWSTNFPPLKWLLTTKHRCSQPMPKN